MPDKLKSRRAVRAAAGLLALSGAALIVPPLVLGERKNTTATTSVQAASRDSFTLSEPITILNEPGVVMTNGTLSVLRDTSAMGFGGTLLDYITGRRAALALDAAEIELDLASGSAAERSAATPSSEILSALLKALSNLEFRSLSLKDVTVNVRLETGRTERVLLQTAECEMPKSGDRIVSGTLIYKGEPVTFDLAVGAPKTADAKSEGSDAPRPVRATLTSKYLEGHFDGRLAVSDRAFISATSATVSVPNIRKAARWLGESWPDGQGLGAFSARGNLLLDSRSLEFQNARFMLDGNSASGTLAVRLAGERPSVEGTLAFDAFNIGPYTAAKKQTPIAVVADWLSDLRLPGTRTASLVTELDADLRLSAKSIVSNAQILGRSAASLNIKGGVLSAELAELELEQGGTGTGELAIDMRSDEPHFTLRGDLHNVDFERALDNRIFASPLDGQGNVMLDLSGSGSSEDQLRASLAGKVMLEMPDGGTLGLDVQALPAVAASVTPGMSAPSPWGTLAQGSTKLDRMIATFSGRDGVFSAETFEATSGDMLMTGLGSIAIGDGTVDMSVRLSPLPASDGAITTGSIPHPEGDAGPAAAATTAVYRVRGPWATPAINVVTNPGKSAEPGVTVPYPAAPKSRG